MTMGHLIKWIKSGVKSGVNSGDNSNIKSGVKNDVNSGVFFFIKWPNVIPKCNCIKVIRESKAPEHTCYLLPAVQLKCPAQKMTPNPNRYYISAFITCKGDVWI